MFAYCGNNPVIGYDPNGEWNWGGFAVGIGIAAIGVVAAVAIASTGGAALPAVAVATKAIASAASIYTAAAGTVTAYAAATDGTMVVDVSVSNGFTHDKLGYSTVIDFQSDSATVDIYSHYGKTSSDYGVSCGVGFVDNYEKAGDYGGYFIDGGATINYKGIDFGIDMCSSPSVSPDRCMAKLLTVGASIPMHNRAKLDMYCGVDYYCPISTLYW